VTSDFTSEVDIQPFRACAIKICNITLIYGRIAEISASQKKSGSKNSTVTSNCRPEVEIWPFHACAMHLAIIIGQFVHCGRGYGADTTFHRTYF